MKTIIALAVLVISGCADINIVTPEQSRPECSVVTTKTVTKDSGQTIPLNNGIITGISRAGINTVITIDRLCK